MENPTLESIKSIIKDNSIVIFGKGSKGAPQCGFTLRAFQIFDSLGVDYFVVNIFDHPSIKPLLVELTGWPTTPQIFINGKFVGGSDIALELLNSGELRNLIQESQPHEK